MHDKVHLRILGSEVAENVYMYIIKKNKKKEMKVQLEVNGTLKFGLEN